MSLARITSFLAMGASRVAVKEPDKGKEPPKIKTWRETGIDLFAAMVSTMAETGLFHPVDTARTRLQYHTGKIRQPHVPFFRSLSKIVIATSSQASLKYLA